MKVSTRVKEEPVANGPKSVRLRHGLNDPHRYGRLTKMKMVLPVGKKKAWRLITSRRGICSWFPFNVEGKLAIGEQLRLAWPGEKPIDYRILYMGPKHSSFSLQRADGVKVRIYLHGRLTTLTLEVEYPQARNVSGDQASEIARWAFFLANLKSVSLKGPDLRNRLQGRSWAKGFID
jgi:hypothetical protein